MKQDRHCSKWLEERQVLVECLANSQKSIFEKVTTIYKENYQLLLDNLLHHLS